jgi:hypothetical protein
VKDERRVARISVYVGRDGAPRSMMARLVIHRELEVPEEEVDLERLADQAAELARAAVLASNRRRG